MGSSRLPGKVLLPLLGEPMLARIMHRLSRSKSLDAVVIATTSQSRDDAIESLCDEKGWSCFRGSESDVLDRYYRAASGQNANVVVRITADCPLIDPGIVDLAVERFQRASPAVDYACTDGFPRGLDTEVIRFSALAAAWHEDDNANWREHVTPYLYRHPERFRLLQVSADRDVSSMRWTVDTPEDFSFASRVYEHFGHADFTWSEVMAALEEHPDWALINRDVMQRELS